MALIQFVPHESGWRGVRSLLKPSPALLINKIYRFFSKPAKKIAGRVNCNSAFSAAMFIILKNIVVDEKP